MFHLFRKVPWICRVEMMTERVISPPPNLRMLSSFIGFCPIMWKDRVLLISHRFITKVAHDL